MDTLDRAPEKPAPNLGDLLEDVLHQAKSLFEAELALAKRELVSDLKSGAVSVALVAVALLFLQAALTTLGVLLVMTVGAGFGGALVVVGMLAVSVTALLFARHLLARRKLARTSARLTTDAKQVMETVK